MTQKTSLFALLLITGIFLMAGCEGKEKMHEGMDGEMGDMHAKHMAEMEATSITSANAVFHPTEGNNAAGNVRFTKVEGGIRVEASLTGLPEGDHGFHIHQLGDCSGSDGKTAGGHFNPAGVDHAGPTSDSRHVGDLGNITADADGNATIDYVDTEVKFAGHHGIIGRGMIVHAGQDDLTSQPTGAAGARLGCAVIGIAGNE